MKRLAQRGDLQERRDAAAARGIGLLHIDRARLEHAAHVVDSIRIFAGGDFHASGGTVPYRSQPIQVVRRYRLLEPAYLLLRKLVCKFDGLLHAIRAVGIHEQNSVFSDSLLRRFDALGIPLRL